MNRRTARRDDAGLAAVSMWLIVFPVLLVAGLALLIDGHQTTRAHTTAHDIAFEAARAGAQAVDIAARRGAGTELLDPDAALDTGREAATTLLAERADAHIVDIRADTTDVWVTIAVDVRPLFPLLSAHTVTATAHVRAVAGITQADQ